MYANLVIYEIIEVKIIREIRFICSTIILTLNDSSSIQIFFQSGFIFYKKKNTILQYKLRIKRASEL